MSEQQSPRAASNRPTVRVSETEVQDQEVAAYFADKIKGARDRSAKATAHPGNARMLNQISPTGELQSLHNISEAFTKGDKSGVVHLLNLDITGLQDRIRQVRESMLPMGQFSDDDKFRLYGKQITEGRVLLNQCPEPLKPWVSSQIGLMQQLKDGTTRGGKLVEMERSEREKQRLGGLRGRLLPPPKHSAAPQVKRP